FLLVVTKCLVVDSFKKNPLKSISQYLNSSKFFPEVAQNAISGHSTQKSLRCRTAPYGLQAKASVSDFDPHSFQHWFEAVKAWAIRPASALFATFMPFAAA